MSDLALSPWRSTWVPPSLGARGARWAILALVGVLVLASVVVALVRHGESGMASVPAPTQAWRTILKPARAYALAAPPLVGSSPWDSAPTAYEARYTFEGAREDVLTLGAFDGRHPAIQLRILRRGPASSHAPPPFAALVREAAQAGLAVSHSTLPDLLPTRFGPFEFAEIVAVPRNGAALPCAGFRLALDQPALAISGLACGRQGAPLSRTAVGCLIERLQIVPEVISDDRDLADFFARTSLRRTAACAGAGPTPVVAKAPVGRAATSRKRLRRR